MATPKAPDDKTGPEHEARVRDAFEDLKGRLGDRADEAARDALEKVQAAAERKDAGATLKQLEAVREHHGWLWEEMSRHPRVASLIDELSLWGF